MALLSLIGVTHYEDEISNALATAAQSVVGLTVGFFTLRYVLMDVAFPHVKDDKRLFYVSNSIVSLLHSLLQLYLIAFYVNGGKFVLNESQVMLIPGATTLEHRLIAAISVGYFIHDTIILLVYEYYYFKKLDYLMMLHHTISFIALQSTIYSHNGGFPVMHVCLNLRFVFSFAFFVILCIPVVLHFFIYPHVSHMFKLQLCV